MRQITKLGSGEGINKLIHTMKKFSVKVNVVCTWQKGMNTKIKKVPKVEIGTYPTLCLVSC